MSNKQNKILYAKIHELEIKILRNPKTNVSHLIHNLIKITKLKDSNLIETILIST